MTSRFLINPSATFGTSKGSHHDSVRAKLFGKPLQHKGLKVKSFSESAPGRTDARPGKLVQRNAKGSGLSKAAASAQLPHEERHHSKPARRRPVEYLGHLITNEQQTDGNWVASFVRMGEAADCAQCTAPQPASYMAFSEAKRHIDAASSRTFSKRQHERVPVALEGKIFTPGITQECRILDLSQAGARLRMHKPVVLEEKLHLYIKGFGRFAARVARSSDNEIAVHFIVDNEAMSGLLKGLSNYVRGLEFAQTKERKEVRMPTSIAAVCQMVDGAAIPCEIIDASMRSMALRISERPRIGSLVTLGGTKVRVVRHHNHGIAVQCLPAPNSKFSRFKFKED